MKKWIRWKGLIAFLIVILLFSAFWFFFVDGLIRRAVEMVGTRVVGAEVDLDKANLSLFPLGITLTRLQVTDPEKPMTNVVEVQRIAFTLDGLNLIRRKAIIDEMAVGGIQLGTPRKISGAVTKKEEKPAETRKSPFALPSFEMADVKKIIEKEDLETLKMAESAQADMKKAEEDWKKRLEALPTKEKIGDYRSRIDKLTKGKKSGAMEFATSAADAKSVKDDIERDLGQVRKLQDEFKKESSAITKRIAEVQQAPKKDAERMMEKYSISPRMLQNMSSLIFGEKIGSWMRTGLAWYGKLRPFIERSKEKKGDLEVVKPVRASGVDVKFREYQPLPDFVIKTADVSSKLEAGTFGGKIENITPDQDVLGRPTTFSLAGSGIRNIGALGINGMLDHIVPSASKDVINLKVSGYRISDLKLSEGTDLPVSLQDGMMDATLEGVLRGDVISAKLTAQIASASFRTGSGEKTTAVMSAVSSALSGVSKVTVQADIQGTLDNYEIKLSSDLDRILKDAVGKALQDQVSKFQNMLTQAISEKTGGSLQALQGNAKGFDALGGQLGGSKDALDGLLSDLLKGG
ncbi:MAG: TIGR03545 family protein, partial [bacterium]